MDFLPFLKARGTGVNACPCLDGQSLDTLCGGGNEVGVTERETLKPVWE